MIHIWRRLLIICFTVSVFKCQNTPTLTRPSIDTGVITLISSMAGRNINTSIQYIRSSFAGAWIYLSICALDVQVITRLSYKVYLHSQTVSSFKVELLQNSGFTLYQLVVRYHQYKHSDLYYSTQYCMLDLKYFDVANTYNSSNSSYLKTGHLTLPRSNYTSQSHRQKCIAHLTGVDLTGQLAVQVQTGINQNQIYIDYTAGPATELAHLTVYVLVIDQYLAMFQAQFSIQYGVAAFNRGVILSNTTTNLNQTQTAAFYGMTSLKVDINTTSLRFDLSIGQVSPVAVQWLTNSYLYLTQQICANSSFSLNIAQSSCFSNLRSLLSCAATGTQPVMHTILNSNSTNGAVQKISISGNKQIIASVSSNIITVFAVQSSNLYAQMQQIDTGFIIAQVQLSSEGLYLAVVGSTVIQVYKLVNNLYMQYFTTYRLAAQFTSVQIDQGGSTIVSCYTKNGTTYLLTHVLDTRQGQYVITQEQDLSIPSSSNVKLVLSTSAAFLMVLSSEGYYVQMRNTAQLGVFHFNSTTRVQLTNISSSQPMFGDLTSDTLTFVVSVEPSAGLRVYHYDTTQQMYSLFQVLTEPLCMASLRAHQVSIADSGLLLTVQAVDENQKYQLIYTRASYQNLFQLVQVINSGLPNSNAETGLQLSKDGQLLVTPVDGNNMAAYYCTSLLLNTKQKRQNMKNSNDDDMTPMQFTMMMLVVCISAASMGCCLFCVVLIRILRAYKSKPQAITPIEDPVLVRNRVNSECNSQIYFNETQQQVEDAQYQNLFNKIETAPTKQQDQIKIEQQPQQYKVDKELELELEFTAPTAQKIQAIQNSKMKKKRIFRGNTKIIYQQTNISVNLQQISNQTQT